MFSFMKSCVGQSSISEQRTDRNKNMTRLCAKGRYDGGGIKMNEMYKENATMTRKEPEAMTA